MNGFEVYSALHAWSVLGCAAAITVAIVLGLRWTSRAPQFERALRVYWCVFVIAFQVLVTLWWLLPRNFDLQRSLPLHLCDVVVWFVPFALFGRSRLLQSLLYFWGIGLSILAFISPILDAGPGQLEFWLFWLGHTQIVGSALYLVIVRGFRPEGRDLKAVALATVVYTAVVVPLNIALNANYGMVGPSTGVSDDFGPWPQRIVVILLLEAALFGLVWLPWIVRARLYRGMQRSIST